MSSLHSALVAVLFPIVLPWIILVYFRRMSSAKLANLQDKVVLITGASSGLGEALAHAFYSAGCKVILAARRTEQLDRVRRDLMASHPHTSNTVSTTLHEPSILTLDISDLKSIPSKADTAIQMHGVVDILVNNSGVSSRSDVLSTSLDVDWNVMVVNYLGHVALTKALLPKMISHGSGHIVAISSVQGRIAIPYRSSYAASKHAMQAFFDTLRAEVHTNNIHVTVISPGYVKTNLSLNALTGDGSKHGVMDSTTDAGIDPRLAAEKILETIVGNKKELILAPLSSKLAIVLRAISPQLYFYFMEQRAKKLKIPSS